MARVAITRLRGALADALRGIAALLRSPQSAAADRQHTVEALARADNFQNAQPIRDGDAAAQTHLPDLDSIERWPVPAFVATSEPLALDVDAQAGCATRRLGWIERLTRRPRAARSRQLQEMRRHSIGDGSTSGGFNV